MKKLDNPLGRAVVRKMLRKSAQQQLASGVTTVRGAGDPLYGDIAVRDGFDAGKYVGPRMITPGTGITVEGGPVSYTHLCAWRTAACGTPTSTRASSGSRGRRGPL